jgi:V/A-type H+-transporting ATPase subunit D
VIRGPNRARLIELRDELAAAHGGREVLEQKRELLRGELMRASHERTLAGARAADALTHARRSLHDARAAMGSAAVDGALLAQPEEAAIARRLTSVVGVPVPRLTLRLPPFRPRYGPLGTDGTLERAGAAWQAALAALVAHADAELAWRALRRGLARTARRLGALENVVIPRLRGELREIAAALDEDERDEALRRRRWLDARKRTRIPRRHGQ